MFTLLQKLMAKNEVPNSLTKSSYVKMMSQFNLLTQKVFRVSNFTFNYYLKG